MATYPLRSRITPTIDLETITIRLRPDAAVPTVEMKGTVLVPAPARAVSSAVIHTAHLTPAGMRFIEEMKTLFGGHVADQKKKEGS